MKKSINSEEFDIEEPREFKFLKKNNNNVPKLSTDYKKLMSQLDQL